LWVFTLYSKYFFGRTKPTNSRYSPGHKTHDGTFIRFISLSGLSGSQQDLALIGAWFAKQKLDEYYVNFNDGGIRIMAFIN
jgi:hypothetical protein